MATMSGLWLVLYGFINKHYNDLITHLKPKKNRLPSFSTAEGFNGNKWKNLVIFFINGPNNRKIEKKEWVSVDGKAIKGTIKDKNQTVC